MPMRTCQNQRATKTRVKGQYFTFIAVIFVSLLAMAQDTVKSNEHEQSGFGREQVGFVPIRQPIPIPQGVLPVMRKDQVVVRCLKSKDSNPSQPPTQWFVAATIHLHDPDENDLLIMPRMLAGGQDLDKSVSGCWDGMKNSPFWILRRVGRGYAVALSESADGLEILSTRSRGFRDIGLAWLSQDALGTEIMKFDGKRYVRFKCADCP
jgi:hypothetical protein